MPDLAEDDAGSLLKDEIPWQFEVVDFTNSACNDYGILIYRVESFETLHLV